MAMRQGAGLLGAGLGGGGLIGMSSAGLTRRTLLRGAAAAGAVGLIGLLPFGASRAAEPVKGGQLNIAATGGSATDSLDPRAFTSIYHANVGLLYGNCLTEIGQGNELVPELAESWEVDPTAKRWVFNIRQGVTFHNGKTLTAEDVIWSLNLHRGTDTKSAGKALLADIAQMTADGPGRVVIELANANVDLAYIMSDYRFIIVPAESADLGAGIGTGPYKVEEFLPGEHLLGMRNENYWKAGRAHADAVDLLAINDVTARTAGLQTGEIHLIERVDLKTLELLKQSPDIQVFRTAGYAHRSFCMLSDTAPFDNLDVRMALKYAVDREEVLTKILRGYGRLGNDHPIASSDPMFAADIPQRTYDPDKAKFHWKKGGYDGPITLHTSEAAFAEAVDAAVLYKEQAAKCGIQIEVQREPADGYWSDVWRKKPFVVASWGGRPTANIMLTTAYKSDAAYNDTHWVRPAFDQLLVAARGELDLAKRKQMYHDMQLMIHEDGGALIAMFYDYIDAARANVGGYEPGNFALSGCRAAERCWLA